MDKNYQEYFIKDGRHIGRYEEMYKNCLDPWKIEELGLRLDMKAALLLLEGHEKNIEFFLDIGCGLGLFTTFLCEKIWRIKPEAKGLISDISPTAVDKAEKRLKDSRLVFLPLDASSLDDKPILREKNFNLIVMAQVLWGILEKIDDIIPALATLLNKDGLILISQHFPDKEKQTYGSKIISSPKDYMHKLEKTGLKMLDSLETNRSSNHHWAAIWQKKL